MSDSDMAYNSSQQSNETACIILGHDRAALQHYCLRCYKNLEITIENVYTLGAGVSQIFPFGFRTLNVQIKAQRDIDIMIPMVSYEDFMKFRQNCVMLGTPSFFYATRGQINFVPIPAVPCEIVVTELCYEE